MAITQDQLELFSKDTTPLKSCTDDTFDVFTLYTPSASYVTALVSL